MIWSDMMDAGFDGSFKRTAECSQPHDLFTATHALPAIGDKVELFWELEKAFYPATVASISPPVNM